MSDLRRQRDQPAGADDGGRGPPPPPREPKTNEFGQLYGDYEPVNYGARNQHYWKKNRGSRGGDAGRGRGRFEPQHHLTDGMKGFLCTTSSKERRCVFEAYNVLNKYSSDGDVIRKQEEKEKSDPEAVAVTNKEEKKSMEQVDEKVVKVVSTEGGAEEAVAPKEKDLDADAEELKTDKPVWKFKSVATKVPNVVFISTTIGDPTGLVHKIFENVTAKKEGRAKHIQRFLPIELTCEYANLDKVRPQLKEVLEKHLKTGHLSYRIVFNSRRNSKLQSDDFILTIADMVSKINPLSFVDLDNPQYTIVVELLNRIMCVGVVTDYLKFKKYNLLEAGTAKANGQEDSRKPSYSKPSSTGGSGSAPGSSSNGKDAEDDDGKPNEATAIDIKQDDPEEEKSDAKDSSSVESVSIAEMAESESKPEPKKQLAATGDQEEGDDSAAALTTTNTDAAAEEEEGDSTKLSQSTAPVPVTTTTSTGGDSGMDGGVASISN